MHLARFKRLTIAAALLAATGAWAQFDPAQVHPEPPPVHARFAAPAVKFDTPAFDPGQIDFTRHEQMMARLQALVDSVATPPRIRRATKPTRASQRRRLEGKSQRSEVKRLRGGRGALGD